MKIDRPSCLTIAGLDPSGGAGIVADIRTFEQVGCRAAAAVTAITFQNSKAVYGSADLAGEQVYKQIESVFKELEIAAIKIGMLPTVGVVRSVARAVKSFGVDKIVLDPVMAASSGAVLIEREAVDAIATELFPLATLVTPNIPEAERLTGVSITDEAALGLAAEAILRTGAGSVLIKGGHFETDSRLSRDFLFTGSTKRVFEAPRVQGVSVRGTGCMLSSAIAANLALGHDLPSAISTAKAYVHGVITDESTLPA